LPSASIIINNYNYGRFLQEAIDSALDQTYATTEVIVVDDGSTDDSREIIASYGNSIIPVLKDNGGQASAFNAGFLVSSGEVVFFLDADDRFFPTTVEAAMNLFEPNIAKMHWPLRVIDEHGEDKGRVVPSQELPEGDSRDFVIGEGPWNCIVAPTTGNAWARAFLERVLPIPEKEWRICTDSYLFTLAPLFGVIKRLSEPQGFYRMHGQNNYSNQKTFDEWLWMELLLYDQACAALSRFCRDTGIQVDPEDWKSKSWLHWLRLATQEIVALVPAGGAFILVDEDSWGTNDNLGGRRRIPFLERDGQYWGAPPDDETAIRELERLRRRSGASFMVFAWPAFWWLNHYSELHRHLRSKFRCVMENERLVAFDLRP
jgi:glycosyltransferase involved in cell wall biosynthesis